MNIRYNYMKLKPIYADFWNTTKLLGCFQGIIATTTHKKKKKNVNQNLTFIKNYKTTEKCYVKIKDGFLKDTKNPK